MDSRDMRVGHMGNQTDPGSKEMRIFGCSVDGFGKFFAKSSIDSRDIDARFLENLALYKPADAAAARANSGTGIRLLAGPRQIIKARIAARFSFDCFRCGAYSSPQCRKPGLCL